ncbi:MAG TPA: iron transporter, partial [Actinoplanes sp.]|nr:iron transporter [Actinoplanes sp.]
VLPGLNTLAYDISGVLDPSAWYTALLTGMVNITPTASVLEVIAWAGYGIPVLFLFLRRSRSVKPAPTPTPAAAPVESADPAPSPRR